MQMEQTVAEARLEQVYSHYKKKGGGLEGEVVALTEKDRLRIELLRAEADDKARCCFVARKIPASACVVVLWEHGCCYAARADCRFNTKRILSRLQASDGCTSITMHNIQCQ